MENSENQAQGYTVTFTPTELLAGAIYGAMRRVSGIDKNRRARYGDPGTDLWQIDIDAALAEMALAKYLDRYWEPLMPNGKVDAKKPDIQPFHQVRSIRHKDRRLILHREDEDRFTFWLVYCNAPTYTILGSIQGHEGKRPEWWQTFTGRPCFMVPQDALTPCDNGAYTSDTVWATAEDYDIHGDIDHF